VLRFVSVKVQSFFMFVSFNFDLEHNSWLHYIRVNSKRKLEGEERRRTVLTVYCQVMPSSRQHPECLFNVTITLLTFPQNQSQELLYDGQSTPDQFVLAPSHLRPTTSTFFFQLNTCGYSPYITSSRVCRLHLLLILASAVIPGFKSRGTHDHILLH
jgi:hypothetical protein